MRTILSLIALAAALSLGSEVFAETAVPSSSSVVLPAQNRELEMQFEKCSSKNSYLQSMLGDLLHDTNSRISELDRESVPNFIKKLCVKESLSSFPNGNLYRLCRKGDITPFSKKPRPCVSEEYTAVTTKAINVASECLGGYVTGAEQNKSQVAQAMFNLMTHESGLHVNAQSFSGAAGAGQLVKGSIQAINRSEISKMIEHSSGANSLVSKNPACGQLLPKILQSPMNGSPRRQCERMSLADGNPLKNMAYTFANVRLNYVTLKKAAFDNHAFSSVYSALNASEKLRLQMTLSTWAHNTGAAGMRKPLQRLLFSYAQSGRKITNVDDFTSELARAMNNFPHPANRSRARRTETSNFYKNIQSRSQKIAKQAGGSCLDQ